MSAPQSPLQRFERSVADLVVQAVPEIVTVTMRDSPDADLTHRDGSRIGLEVVRAADQHAAFGEKRMEQARGHFESALRDVGASGSYTIYFDLLDICVGSNREFIQWLRTTTPQLVAALRTMSGTRSRGRIAASTLQAHGVTRIAYVETATPISRLLFVGRGYRHRYLPGNSIAETVLRKKDERLIGYRRANGDLFKEYWLAISSIGPGTAEDGGFSMLMDRTFGTAFDRVFLIYRAIPGMGIPARAVDVTPVRGNSNRVSA